MNSGRLEPLKTKLTRPWRRALTVFWILCFFVISPITILYTAGYRYNVDGGITRTGVISINIEPEDARVYLNDILIEEKIPLKLNNRTPGRYHIRIEKDGFYAWNQDVLVRSNQTTYIRDVQLIENHEPRQINVPGDIIEIFSGSDGKVFFLLKRNSLYELSTYDVKRKQRISLARFSSMEIPEILNTQNEGIALIAQEKAGPKMYLVTRQGELHSFTLDSSDDISLSWTSDSNTVAYISHNDQIDALLENGKRTLLGIAQTPLWFVYDKALYTISENTLYKHEKNERTSVMSLKTDYLLTDIIDITNDRIVLDTDNGLDIFSVDLKKGKINEHRHIFTYHRYTREKDGRKLAWSWWELWELFDDGGATLLNRSSEKIVRVFELDDAETLVLQTSNKLIAFNAGYFVSTDMYEADEIHSIAIDQKNRTLFIFGVVSGVDGLFSLSY